MTAKLALCCICGNESRYARRFFETFRPHVDALVVVRACGSAAPDDTLEIAREFGCITAEYHNAPENASWAHVDNFGAARQMSFDLAPPECDWLLWADFDDVASPESLRNLRAHADLQGHLYDWFFTAYEMPTGQTTWRERMVRRGTAKWVFRIHEHLAEITTHERDINVVNWGLPDGDEAGAALSPSPKCEEPGEANRGPAGPRLRRSRVRDVVWIHEPYEYRASSHYRNVAILERYAAEHPHYVYYLHVDHFLHMPAAATEQERLEDRLNAIAYGTRYLEMRDRAPVFEYGVLINLQQIAVTFQERCTLGWRAFRLMPWLREAVVVLCEQALEVNKPITARALARLFSAIPRPSADLAPYFLRPEWYGWAGVDLYARVARFCGDEENARLNESKMLERGGQRISLLHATRGRPEKAANTRAMWLHRAANPEGIEHIFAVDEDDAAALAGLKQYRKVVVPPGGGCVAAWNAAAAASTCAVLVQLSDDWEPPIGWDGLILERLGDVSQPAVLAISDGHRKDQLLCMAILTRARYEQQVFTPATGDRRCLSPTPHLFCPEYTGVFSDNEFTDRAYADGVVIEARDLVFEHTNPLLTGDKQAWDPTYAAQNAPERYEHGRAVYARRKALYAAHDSQPAARCRNPQPCARPERDTAPAR